MGGRRGGERAGVGQAAPRRGRGGTAHGARAGARGRDTAAAGAGSGPERRAVRWGVMHGMENGATANRADRHVGVELNGGN